MDSDVTLRQHTDDLFLLPSTAVAIPRAYWKLPGSKSLSPSFMVLEPSEVESKRIIEYDDVDRLYGDSALVLPHRKYALISGEFRAKDHTAYFGNDYEKWDPDRAVREASLIHFADWPLPKPWIMWPHEALREMRPTCDARNTPPDREVCRDREIWMDLYDSYRRRRKVYRYRRLESF